MAPASQAQGLSDTNVLVDAMRGLAEAVTFLAVQQSAGGVHISVISAMELVAGCHNAAELAQLQRFLQQVTVLPISTSLSQTAYQLMEAFSLSHGLLIPDALIAATALEHGLALYTNNVRHFQMIPRLTVVRPY